MGRITLRMTLVVVLTSTAAMGSSGPAWDDLGIGNGCGWVPGFWSRDFDRGVDAFAVFDDGSGPALYTGGSFRHVNGRPAAGLVRWDSDGWTTFEGDDGFWAGGIIYALTVFDDGTGQALHAAGGRLDEYGQGYPVVARWDGSGWTELGVLSPENHESGWVSALIEYDDGSGPALFAGGVFDFADGIRVDNVAKWNGTTWEPLAGPMGTGVDHWVEALAVLDDGTGPGLYVGGAFTYAGGRELNNIARWDGTDWDGLPGSTGTGTNYKVNTLKVWDDGTGSALFVGGWFTEAGGVLAVLVAKWTGSGWSDLSGPAGNGIWGGEWEVNDLIVFDDGSGEKLYAAGDFETAGGIEANNIARWDGSAWSAVGVSEGNGTSGTVEVLGVVDVGGGEVLVAGGGFNLAGGAPVGKIARWDGQTWSPFSENTGHGVGSPILALRSYDNGNGPEMIAAGYFDNAGDIAAGKIAAWDGTGWRALEGPAGNGVDGDVVRALQVWDRGSGPELYAAGNFDNAGGVEAQYIARWDGAGWSALAGSEGFWSGGIRTLALYDDGQGEILYAGGSFTEISGVEANRVAKWNGSGWSALIGPGGNGVGQGDVNDLEVFDDGSGPALFVGGFFEEAGGIQANGIAKWDGQDWSALVGPGGNGVGEHWVRAMEVFDDGGGPDLYVGGSFETAGGVTVNNIARWNGSDWSIVDGPSGFGVDGGEITSLEVFDDGSGPALIVGGGFDTAGGVEAIRIARWDGTEWTPIEGPAGKGADMTIWAIRGMHDGIGPALFVGGNLTSAGGLASESFGVWRCPDNLLFADGFELGGTGFWSRTVP